MANRIRLYPWELESMPEYSCSIPSGTVMWKMWRRNCNAYAIGVRCPSCLFEDKASPECRLQCPKCKFEELKKFQLPERWVVGQYVPCDIPGEIGIRWYEVQLLTGPKPRIYNPPDWHNYKRWKQEHDEERIQGNV